MRAVPLSIGLTLLAAACGGSPAATSSGTARTNASLAFARCMRSHGVPSFPDPDAQGDFPAFRAGVSKQISSAANETCKHLLPVTGGGTATPHQEQQKLAFGVKVAECLRTHGFPTMPDPSRLGSNQLPAGIDESSPRFQSAESSCEQRARKALGLP